MDDDGSVVADNDTDLQEAASSVWPHQHDEIVIEVLDEDGVVEAVDDVGIHNSVPPGALDDLWGIIHDHKLSCHCDSSKLTCDSS